MVLARVELDRPITSLGLPAHAFLQDAADREYLLVFATESRLESTGWTWTLLARAVDPEEIVIATEMRHGARLAASGDFHPLLDDGRQWVLRLRPEQVEALAAFGFSLQRLDANPILANPRYGGAAMGDDPARFGPPPTAADPLVSTMVESLHGTNLWWMVRRLSGSEPVVAGGKAALVTSRHTSAGLPLRNGLEMARERFLALGLQVSMLAWSNSGYTGSNLVATLPGSLRSNELVLVTAHFDDMPLGALAPGADDNASGSAAVLAAAGVFCQYRFDRSIRFVLFTGEEQGMLGSVRYAAAARTSGDNIVAVLNLDMLAWNATGQPVLRLHTRTPSNPGYAADLAIASVFTNVTALYNLRDNLLPVITADGITASDHSPFWNNGYPAVLAIEDYPSDFHAFYHTVNDTLGYFNMPYFTAAARASIATVAHLAVPLDRAGMEVLEVANSDWNPGSGIGAGLLLARHMPGASASGNDPHDGERPPFPEPYPKSLRIVTRPYGLDLVKDSRPANSNTVFHASLIASSTSTAVSCSNLLRFDLLSAPAPNRLLTARIHIPRAQAPDFLCVTNLRQVVGLGGFIGLPPLEEVPANSDYGSCDIAARTMETNCTLRLEAVRDRTVILATQGQVGCELVDDLETCSDLSAPVWIHVASFTNRVEADATSFESGWQVLDRTVDLSPIPDATRRYFRLERKVLRALHDRFPE